MARLLLWDLRKRQVNMVSNQAKNKRNILLRTPLSGRHRTREDNSHPIVSGADRILHVLNRRGFTLLEVMVTVVLVGIMAAIAVPSIRAWLPHYQLRMAKNDLVNTLYLGKMRAIATGHRMYVDFDPNGDGTLNEAAFTGYLDTDDDGSRGEANNAAGENEFTESQVVLPKRSGGIPVVEFPGRISTGALDGTPAVPNGSAIGDGIEANNDRIEFLPSGRVTLNGDGTLPTIYLRSDRDEQCAIQVNMLGQIIVYQWEDSAWAS